MLSLQLLPREGLPPPQPSCCCAPGPDLCSSEAHKPCLRFGTTIKPYLIHIPSFDLIVCSQEKDAARAHWRSMPGYDSVGGGHTQVAATHRTRLGASLQAKLIRIQKGNSRVQCTKAQSRQEHNPPVQKKQPSIESHHLGQHCPLRLATALQGNTCLCSFTLTFLPRSFGEILGTDPGS